MPTSRTAPMRGEPEATAETATGGSATGGHITAHVDALLAAGRFGTRSLPQLVAELPGIDTAMLVATLVRLAAAGRLERRLQIFSPVTSQVWREVTSVTEVPTCFVHTDGTEYPLLLEHLRVVYRAGRASS